jgi:hypothetical protein
MQCPNCYTETPIALSRCVKCDAPLPLHRRSAPPSGYGPPSGHGPPSGLDPPSAFEPRSAYNPPSAFEPSPAYDPPSAFDQPYDPDEARWADGFESGYEDGSASGYGSPENWEPATEWHPEWLPPERAHARPVRHRPESPQTEPAAKSRHPLLIAMIIGVALGAVAAVGIAVWPSGDRAATTPDSAGSAAQSGDASGAPNSTAHAQATAIDGLLDEMTATRSTLVPAIGDAARCDGIDDAIGRLERARKERQDQLDKAKALKVDALLDGPDLRETLTRAAGYSLDADKAFLAWAKANQGCTDAKTPRDDNFERGRRLSTDHATPEKENFVELWNPVARDEGLPARSSRKL